MPAGPMSAGPMPRWTCIRLSKGYHHFDRFSSSLLIDC